METYIYVKPKFTKYGIKELVRIVFNPYNEPAKKIMEFWIEHKFQNECYAVNKKD